MGFSSWNNFGDNINETLFKQVIDSMDRNGLREAGFVYVNLDDGWQRYKGDRKDHPLEADPVKFPSGIKALADYAHGKGFKLGIYNGPGETTCAGYTGSANHEAEDAAMFASWGIDHLKYDACCSHENAPQEEVKNFITHVIADGPIFGSGLLQWVQINGGLVKTLVTISITLETVRSISLMSWICWIEGTTSLNTLAQGIGMIMILMLIVGLNGQSSQLLGTGASDVEYRSHFSLWAMATSPLLIGADARTLSTETLETLMNKEVIELSQDLMGAAAEVVREEPGDGGTLQVYAKEMSDGSYAVALLNRGSSTAEMSVSPRRDLTIDWDTYRLRDLWKHEDHGPYDITYTTEVMSHEAKVLRLYPITNGSST
ncbi:hypothetical protein HYALB_00012303 [Hymenoscyphus albidus]|uniref:Alpha-galactosidase n=1 Tax=Hymenoscyphus albidus TaxID=595503 RepID=A0A9N9QB86_9HELO|nr:hypothetical protein HYALB_00012303 [Hymenoscyphus albidus]